MTLEFEVCDWLFSFPLGLLGGCQMATVGKTENHSPHGLEEKDMKAHYAFQENAPKSTIKVSTTPQ